MKNVSYYHVDEIASLKDMLENSVKKFGSKNAFLVKKDKKSAYEGVTYNNFSKDVEGLGTAFMRMELAGKKIAVINAIGRVNMDAMDCPFRATENCLEEIGDKADIKIIDFHAETSSRT